jgi:hypothetical protein
MLAITFGSTSYINCVGCWIGPALDGQGEMGAIFELHVTDQNFDQNEQGELLCWELLGLNSAGIKSSPMKDRSHPL